MCVYPWFLGTYCYDASHNVSHEQQHISSSFLERTDSRAFARPGAGRIETQRALVRAAGHADVRCCCQLGGDVAGPSGQR